MLILMETQNDRLRRERLKTLGLAIAQQRELKHISQRQLARMLGYTNHSYLSRIENGKKSPSLETVFEIATILEIDVHTLFIDM